MNTGGRVHFFLTDPTVQYCRLSFPFAGSFDCHNKIAARCLTLGFVFQNFRALLDVFRASPVPL